MDVSKLLEWLKVSSEHLAGIFLGIYTLTARMDSARGCADVRSDQRLNGHGFIERPLTGPAAVWRKIYIRQRSTWRHKQSVASLVTRFLLA